jgi:SAM-dependent methyltransferase
MTDEMVRYYARRAQEYDRVYTMPRWQADLAILHERIPALCSGRRVYEVACGTGYWTERIARTAASVEASDTNDETLAIARARAGVSARVRLLRRDAYAPSVEPPRSDAGLAALWLSHVDRARMTEFLDAFHSYLLPGSPVLMFDERDTSVRPVPASRLDEAGNRYEMRRLADGERFEIIKNFFEESEMRRLLAPHGHDVKYEALEAFWVVTYTTPAASVRQSGGEG